MRIDGSTALITGASEGIGAACVRAFRERGARIVLAARDEAKLAQVAGADDFVIAGDLLNEEDRKRIVDAALSRFGRIDILVNNAGIGLYQPAHVADMPQVRHMFELNFFAPLALTQLIVPAMRQQRGGFIVNISSVAGKVTLPWFTLYSASKYALCSLSDGLRMELKSAGIHVMTVCPGYVRTGFQSHVLHGQAPATLTKNRNRFSISAEQCAAAVVKGVEKGARTVVTPWSGWLFVAAERLFPGLMDAQLERMSRTQR